MPSHSFHHVCEAFSAYSSSLSSGFTCLFGQKVTGNTFTVNKQHKSRYCFHLWVYEEIDLDSCLAELNILFEV